MQHTLCIAASRPAFRCCSPPWAFPPKLGRSPERPLFGQCRVPRAHPLGIVRGSSVGLLWCGFPSLVAEGDQMFVALMSLAEDTALLAIEVQVVIGMRLGRLSFGGAGRR